MKTQWSEEYAKALGRLKQIFSNRPILMALNISKTFTLATDCSAVEMGCA